MKLINFLAAVPFAAAFVLPDQELFAQIAVEEPKQPYWNIDKAFDKAFDSAKEEIKRVGHHVGHQVKSGLGSAKQAVHSSLDAAFELSHDFQHTLAEETFDAQSWANAGFNKVSHGHEHHRDHHCERNPHDRPPHDCPPHHGLPRDGRPRHGPPHRGGSHGRDHHDKPDQTVYELIASSKYTTKLAKALEDYPDLIEALNGTKANYTLFAPTDAAFAKIPKDAPKPSKEFLRMILEYHVSPHFYPAGRVLGTYTIPTLLDSDELADEPMPQRLAVKLTLRGLTLNYYARIVAVDIFATNGVIHGLDSFVLPPPRTLKIIDLLPSTFSTFELALTKTGLLEDISKSPVKGGTLFIPDNSAFSKLGPGLNAFLFSPRGLKYLKALLQYHVVPETTLYSDALYEPSDDQDDQAGIEFNTNPRRSLHLDLPTMLEDHSLSVDVGRTGPSIEILINGFSRVTAHDGVARDGVIHVVSNVLIPPRGRDDDSEDYASRTHISVADLKARLADYVD